MKGESPSPSELVDLAESLRQEGRIEEALQTIKRSLEMEPQHPRAVLLLGRLLYQKGNVSQALSELRSLNAVLGEDNGFRTLNRGLQEMLEAKHARIENHDFESFFTTESMAQLLTQQGYHLEALKVYRQLYLASGGQPNFWRAILEIRDRLEREGSRGTRKEAVAEELAHLNSWIEARQRES
jgi:tetratricopeptide (TPR) repeat protein